MNRSAKVYMHEHYAGYLTETDVGYSFMYDTTYLQSAQPQAISNTLPLTTNEYTSKVLFSFFDGLIPEGWLLDLAEQNWKLLEKDRFGLLLACCKNCIGAVSIIANQYEKL
jgi:serine/threonine-protein kinase HipA